MALEVNSRGIPAILSKWRLPFEIPLIPNVDIPAIMRSYPAFKPVSGRSAGARRVKIFS